MDSVRQAVILAGGRGTRLGALTDRLPKPMVLVNGRPFIEYVVEMLRDAGIRRILFLLGYLPQRIIEHFGDGSAFGVSIEYSTSAVTDETGTRLRNVRDRLDLAFLLSYCDNYWPVPLAALERAFSESGCRAMLTVYRNTDAYTRDNVRIEGNRVASYDKSRMQHDLSGVDIGYGIFYADVVDCVPRVGNPSFEATVYPRLVAERTLAAFRTDHRYYSVGSAERLPLTTDFFRGDKTVLVDRDGTLNISMPRGEYVSRWEEWQWIPGAIGALTRLTVGGYRVVVVTNQPGVSRGSLTLAELDAIHARMIAEAAEAGARIEAVLACAHGWDEECACRKPQPGLLFEAQRRFSLDLSRTPFIGDDDRDAIAAQRAGAPFLRVSAALSFSGHVDRLLKGGAHF